MEKIHSISGNWLYTGDMSLLVPWMERNEPQTLGLPGFPPGYPL